MPSAAGKGAAGLIGPAASLVAVLILSKEKLPLRAQPPVAPCFSLGVFCSTAKSVAVANAVDP